MGRVWCLNDLYGRLKVFRFRCRDISTLRDYLCVQSQPLKNRSGPVYYDLIGLDDGYPTVKSGDEQKWCLLSSHEELVRTTRYKIRVLSETFQRLYQENGQVLI